MNTSKSTDYKSQIAPSPSSVVRTSITSEDRHARSHSHSHSHSHSNSHSRSRTASPLKIKSLSTSLPVDDDRFLKPKALSPAEAQSTQRQFASFIKDTKALFTLISKVLSSAKEYKMNCVHLTRKLKALYESGESAVSRDIERLYMAIDDDEMNGVSEIEDFETELLRAEKWIRSAKKSVKGEKVEELAYFMEQRFDGLDKVVTTFLQLAKKELSPKAQRTYNLIDMSLKDIGTLRRTCPTNCDSGESALVSTESLISQWIPSFYLHLYLSTLLTEESIDFIMEVKVLEELYKENPTSQAVIDKAHFIVNTFVSDTCDNELNLTESTKKLIEASFSKVPFSIEPFAIAVGEVTRNMTAADVIGSFKQSAYYDKLIRRLTPRPYSMKLLSDIGSSPNSTPTLDDFEYGDKGREKSIYSDKRDRDSDFKAKQRQSFRKVLHSGAAHTFMSLRSKELPNGKLVTINDVLQNKALYKDFKKFTQEKGCPRSLAFVRDVTKFAAKHFSNPNEAREEAATIFETYLIACDSERGVGVSIETQQKLYTLIYDREDEPIKNTLFKNACLEAIEVMRLTIFVQYVVSERWLAVTWTPDDVAPNHRLSTSARHRRGTAATSVAPPEITYSEFSPSDLAIAAAALPPVVPHKSSSPAPAARATPKRQKERRNTFSDPSSNEPHTVSPPPPQYTPQQQQSQSQVTASQLYHSLRMGIKSREKSPHPEPKPRSLSRKSSLAVIHSSSPVPAIPLQLKSPETATIAAEPPTDDSLGFDPEASAVVSVSPLRPSSPLASADAPEKVEKDKRKDKGETGRGKERREKGRPASTEPSILSISTSLASELSSLADLASTDGNAGSSGLRRPDLRRAMDAERGGSSSGYLETPRTADARKELLKNYRANILPKLEKLTSELSKLVGLDELSEQRGNVHLIQTVSRCLSDVSISSNVPKPTFTVIHPNAKFVQFRKNLLYCTWEVSKKVSIIIQNLALNCPCSIQMTMPGTVAKYRDVYHSIVLAFSTTTPATH